MISWFMEILELAVRPPFKSFHLLSAFALAAKIWVAPSTPPELFGSPGLNQFSVVAGLVDQLILNSSPVIHCS